MTNNEQVLLESQTARTSQLEQIEDRAEELLGKAKALHFNVWQGTGIATTGQVAEFYEVPIKTVESALKCHRSELDSDGLKVLRGEDLKLFKLSPEFVTLNFKVTNKARNLTIWNPRSTLRLGYLLRDSAIAKAVRTTSLDFIEKAPQQAAPPTQPKSQAEMFIICAQQFFDHDQRLKSVESDVQEMKQIRIDAIKELHQLPPSKEPAPPLSERASLRQLINQWCDATKVDQQIAWRKLYTELYYRDGFNVNTRMKKGEYKTKLDLIASCGKISVLYAIARDIFGSGNGQGGSRA